MFFYLLWLEVWKIPKVYKFLNTGGGYPVKPMEYGKGLYTLKFICIKCIINFFQVKILVM